MNKEEIKELKDYHKRCIESIDNYYLSDSFYEIHNKVFKELEELHNKIDKAIKYVSQLSSKGRDCEIYWDIKQEILKILRDGDVDE